MIRYQIQSEYGLSDPELYAAPGEEDDPEALLEGVAMAGLVGVLRQLGDLAEFAAEIFHDLHEDVMATASRGHGLMLRLQQLEAEFPAVEKAIISQNDHSNYPHDDGVEWHANLQLRQNMITQGDMPRFILDSYEECRGPPHLFTLDKFDVAGAGASLKRYSDPSFFKIEHASNMTETDVVIEKKPRRIKKKAMRWRKGVTLESLLIANSGPQTTSKDRTSRKVPPRTTKLKSRHPRSPDHKTVGRICSEHLQEIISSQQKILSSYCTRHYHVKFRSTHSSETTSPYGELDNFGTLVQSSGKLELTKVVPLNESDTVESTSAPTNGSAYLEAGDKQFLGKQDGPTELKEVCNMSLVEQNCMAPHSEKLQDCPDFLVRESNRGLQSAHEEKLLLGAVPADHDVDGCRLDDIASDQDNLVDALNNMDSEGEADPEMKNEWDFSANVEGNELNCQSKEGENALDAQFQEVGPAINSSCGLNGSCNGGEQTCVDLPLISDSAPSVASTNNGPNSGSPPGIRLNGVDWTNDEEPFNDEDLMDVSSSSSTVSDNADMQTNDDLVGCQQYQEGANHSVNDDHAAVIESFDKWSPTTYGSLNGLAISNNDYTDKAYHLEHDQNFELDGTSMLLSKSNNVSEDEEDINVGIADDLFLHPTTNQEEMQESKKEFDKGKSLDTCTSPGKLASLPNKDHGMCMNDLEMDNVSVSEDIVVDTTPMGLDPDIHDHLDVDLGSAPTHSSMRYNKLYESHDDEIVEDVHSVPDRDLSTPYKFVAEDHRIVVLEEGTFSASLNTHKEDSMQASVMAREFSYAQELPGIIEGVSPSQDDTKAYVGETLAPSSCVLNDDTEPLKIGVPLAPTTSYLSDNSSSCVEQHTLTEMEDTVECGKFVVAEESTANKFTDDVAPPEEEFTDASKCTEKAEVLITNSTKEDSRHDSQLESSSPFREGMETVKATCRNLEEVDKSSEHISKKSMLQPVNIHPFIEMEIAGEKCSDSDDIQFISSARFLEESDYQEELLEEASVNAEVLSWCNSDKDGAVSLKSNTVAKQPADVNQDLVWGMSAQDSSSTNPFMDPAYTTSHAQIYPSPSMNYQPFSEEQDVLSELLTQDDNTEAAAGSLWEPATPPDEAPLSPEVLTEDFRSFCHEYHEIDFTAGTEGCHGEPASDSKNMSNAFVDSEPDLPCSVSALPVVLDHEACVHSKFGSRHAECSSATDIEANTSMPFSSKEGLENETPGVDSHLKSRESFSDNQNPELDMLSVPVNLQQEQHDLSGVDSHNSSRLVDKENTTEECCSPSSNNVLVKKELEIRENLIPHSSINEKVGELDVPPSNDAPVAPEVGARVLNEYDGKDVPCCSSKEIDAITSSNSVLVQGSEVCVFGEFDSPVVPPSADVNEDNLEASALRTYFRAEQEPECCVSGEHDSQRVQPSSLDEKTDELDGPPLNNAVVLDQEPDVCSSSGLNSRITPYSSTDEKIYEPNFPLRSSVLVDPESEDYVSGGLDSQVTPCYLVKDKIDESEAAQSNSILPEELKQAAHATPELDSQVAPCSLKDDNVGEIDGPPSCNVWVESEKEAYQLSPGPPPTVPFQNDSYEDSQKPPPLPPLQWRLGRPRLGLLSTEGCMPEPARRIDSVFQASNQEMDTRLGLLDRMNRSIEPVPSQVIKEDKYQNSMMDDNDRNGEFGRLSTSLAVTDVARTEHGLPFSEGSENIKQQGPMSSPAIGVEEHLDDTGVTSATGVEDNDRNVGFGRLLTSLAETDVARTEHGLPFSEGSESTKQQGPMSSSAIGVEEHLDDTGVTSATGVEEHLDDSGVTHGTDLYVSYPLLPFPTYEKQGPQPCILSSDTEHPSLTHPTASEDDKSVDVYNTAGSMVSTSTTGHVSENRCYQQDQCGESFSENPDHKEHITNASEDKSVKQQPSTSEEPSDTANHSAPGSLLEEGNNQEKQNAKSSENKPGGSLPSAESMAIQDYPHDEHNLEREKMQQPSGPGPFVLWPGDRNNFASGLDEDSSVHADQPPLMGWTVGPQMIHPKYGILIEESQFVPNITDNHLIRKPISIKNIPRNPLVDAVAAHDRSSMRKVSELAPPTDKLKPNERNLLLEQIRNKTFNLKPVGSAKPTALRSPARANTRNLKVAAIIEKANAIRQAVGSDDEDADNWSDS